MQRRTFLGTSLAAAAISSGLANASERGEMPLSSLPAQSKLKGNLKQSVSRWCYGGMSIDDLCKNAAAIGLKGIDLLDEADWDVPAKYGLVCSMPNGPWNIPVGWNRAENHDELVKKAEALMPKVASKKIGRIIVFSGNKGNTSEADGIRNCVAGLKRIMPTAEKLGLDVCIEYLNSRHDHGDYQFDHTSFGVEICKQVGSPRMKILYDLYHVQIMEGDLIARIGEIQSYIGHFHTGGVPGRNEIDETQETNYSAVAKAIVGYGYKGFLAHEFIPTKDPMTSLRRAAEICDA
jgi:hydroxypyruvate isomerase